MFPDNNEKAFENDFIFCMFTWITECKIELLIDFPNEEDRRRRRKEQTEGKPKDSQYLDNKDDDYEARREANLAKFIVKKPSAPQNDIIEDNIRKVSLWNRISAKERLFIRTRQ